MITRRRAMGLLAASLASPPAGGCAEVAGRAIDLKVEGDFGKASARDIKAVLLSAADAVWQHCPRTRWEVPGFFIYRSKDAPITAYDHRADGRIAIGLTAQGNYWSQFAFQFAHEFCHALAGHSNDWRRKWIKGRKANHWLEESICETASLFAMRAMGRSWQTAPPYPNWKDYAGALTRYVDERLEKSAAALPERSSFPGWFRVNEPAMRRDAAIREKNNIVAMMLLPLFEATPAGWEAVTTLNEGKRDPEISLAAHFSSWAATAPAAQQSFITAIAAVFGVKPA